MKKINKFISFCLAMLILLSNFIFLPITVEGANSVTNSYFESMYGAHLNYRSVLTQNDDMSYTFVVDVYSSYAINPSNVNILSSKDDYCSCAFIGSLSGRS